MNFLLEFSTVGYDVRNYMASKLCKLYPGSKFAAIVGAHKNVIGYLKEQKLVKYDFIYNIDNIEKRFLDEGIDSITDKRKGKPKELLSKKQREEIILIVKTKTPKP